MAVLYSYASHLLRVDQQKLGAGVVLASMIAALLIGVAVHRVSASLLVINRVIYRESALSGIVRRFEYLPTVHANLKKHLGFEARDAVDAYYYGKILVDERLPRTAESADRLMSMALLCRNMLLAIPIAAGALLAHERRRKRPHGRRVMAGILFAAVILEYLFLKGFLSYWSASVWRILRALVTLS
ncbi:MAG TPA: hypothetical protein VGQ76_16715 [Thermoanaerobaculia bacterium]|nr:hypothetical protein [Thermoanaerobaculia bacterium]